MKTKITVKKYTFDESASWEERYKQLEKHHLEETTFLIMKIEELETKIEDMNDAWAHHSTFCNDDGYRAGM